MLKKICKIGWLPVMILFTLGTMTITDNLRFSIGNEETTGLFVLFILLSFVVAFFQFAKEYSKYLIGVYVLFLAFLFLILGYSSLPEQKVKRARDHYSQFEYTALSSANNDDLHSIRVDYVQREQKARQLELEAAELRYDGPTEFYGVETWEYILFFSAIGLLISYAVAWFIYLPPARPNLQFG